MKKISIICGAFHRELVERQLAEARSVAQELGVEIVSEIWVHGSLEKPLALKRLLLQPEIQGAVVLGIIERGETKHGLVMGQVVMQAIINLQLEFMKPVGVGILGPEILPEQIEKRLRSYAREAVVAVAAMIQ